MSAVPARQTTQPRGEDANSADRVREDESRLAWAGVLSSRLLLPVILLVAFALYAPTLDDWFFADDFWFLRSSQATPMGEYVAEAFDFRQTGTSPELDRYRPLYPVVWRLMYSAFGQDALGYHALLVALHLGCTVLVWFIAFRLIKLTWAANLAALIFAVHPVYTDAVAWISGGNRLLVTFPYLLCLLLFMRYADGKGRRGACYLGSFLAFLTAILLHSTALTLAVVLPAYAFLVAGRPAESLRARSWIRFAPFAAASLALIGIQVWVRTHLGVEESFRFGWHQYGNYGHYLGMALFPVFPVNIERFADPLPPLLSALEGVASVAMILTTVVLLTQRRWPYLGLFIVLWLYVSLLPDSTLTMGAYGRTLYMSGASLAIFFVVALLYLKETLPASLLRLGTRAAPFLVMAVLVPTALLALHHIRGLGEDAAENEAFITQLRRSVPRLDPQAVLYVVRSPRNLTVFDDTRLDALVELYYGEVEVRSLSVAEAAEMEASPAGEYRIFRFGP